MLIGIHGKKRSGKDTTASIIEDLTCTDQEFKRYALADPIHRALRIGFCDNGWELSVQDVKGMTNWSRDTPLRLSHDLCDEIMWSAIEHLFFYWKAFPNEDLGKIKDLMFEVIEDAGPSWCFRDFMQKLGTDIFVKYKKDIWLNHVPDLNTSNVILSDIRQQHEIDYVREHGVMLFVYSDREMRDDTHITEQGLEPLDGEYIIYNNGSIEDLENHVKDFLKCKIKLNNCNNN